MSKRFFPQQHGDRKKARLDISISDHNFPLSQNKETDHIDTWGDDKDDEILLLASQACEDAYSKNDISSLPDYSICMQPPSTSTQMYNQAGPSTSKTDFTFKKPTSHQSSIITTNLKEKCNRISSPLPGISSKVVRNMNGQVNLSDDLIFNDKICKGQDSDYVYRQLLQLQEENAKLKSDNGKLLEKCVTKEGEASILRTQLKSCQISVDNARLEKIKAQEKVQMDWTEKLAAASSQMHDLKTQLDFKNLEIISIKEKCKKLESTKMKLTQVTVGNNDISSSHRLNNSIMNDSVTIQSRRVKTVSNGMQTDIKALFLKLNKTLRLESPSLRAILPQILAPTAHHQHSLLDYNEKLWKQTDLSPNPCRVFSTFHRIPSTPITKENKIRKVQLACIYEDLTCIATGNYQQEKHFNVFKAIKAVLNEVRNRLETIHQRMTTAFQREMNEKYIEATSSYRDVSKENLLQGSALFKEEQEILARRMTAILAYILTSSKSVDLFNKYEEALTNDTDGQFINCINRICTLLDNTSCATVYSGLLLSINKVAETLLKHNVTVNKIGILSLIKTMLVSRAMPFVACSLLALVRQISLWDNFKGIFCLGSSSCNLKLDYDQGVLLYKKDSCFVQVLLKQIETCLKCIENQKLTSNALETTRNLIILHSNMYDGNTSLLQDKSRCDCQLVHLQVIVYALRICVVMLNNSESTLDNPENSSEPRELLAVCRCGVHLLYQCVLRDVEFGSLLGHNEGHLIEFCEHMRRFEHSEVYTNMLTELAGTLQSSPEDMPPSFHKQPWLKSFETFAMSD